MLWHCPHCGAPQAETARCWVCHRSSTTCSTCRHFRVSLSASLGFCALDPRRRPLTGLELRGCWQERPAAAGSETPTRPRPTTPDVPLRALRGFVPIADLAVPAPKPQPPSEAPSSDAPAPPTAPGVIADAAEAWEQRTSLFGDLDR